MYLVVVLCVAEAELVATPVMLLFTTFTAAWFLSPRTLWVHLVAVVPLCWIVLAPRHDDAAVLAIQVVVHAGVLNACAVALFVMRRRVERLVARRTTSPGSIR